jgi:hypothetical protein
MAATSRAGRSGTAAETPPRDNWPDDLRRADELLRTIIAVSEEEPRALDSAVLSATGDPENVNAALAAAYRIMKNQVYAADSRLRADGDTWAAFKEQEGEFSGFYRSARNAVEAYAQVLQAYQAVSSSPGARSQHGELKRIRRDKHEQLAERDSCLEALTDFQGKLSAMVSVLLDPRAVTAGRGN